MGNEHSNFTEGLALGMVSLEVSVSSIKIFLALLTMLLKFARPRDFPCCSDELRGQLLGCADRRIRLNQFRRQVPKLIFRAEEYSYYVFHEAVRLVSYESAMFPLPLGSFIDE